MKEVQRKNNNSSSNKITLILCISALRNADKKKNLYKISVS